jgi:hypothetical protein
MANDFSTAINTLATELLAGLAAGYTPNLKVVARHYEAGKIPNFDRYCIIIAPAASNTWIETVKAVRNFQYVFSIDAYLMVKNFDDFNSLFGETSPNKGLFEMINDFKDLIRATTLSGLLDKTYSEPGGPVSIEYAASSGFDSGEHSFIRRAKIPCQFRMRTFCIPLTP